MCPAGSPLTSPIIVFPLLAAPSPTLHSGPSSVGRVHRQDTTVSGCIPGPSPFLSSRSAASGAEASPLGCRQLTMISPLKNRVSFLTPRYPAEPLLSHLQNKDPKESPLPIASSFTSQVSACFGEGTSLVTLSSSFSMPHMPMAWPR